jgi:hypothetical protein
MGLIQAMRRLLVGPPSAPPGPIIAAAKPAKARPRIGILFVHGMGEQQRGDTLTQMGDAVSEWIRRAVQADPNVDFSIRHAVLRSGEHLASDDEISLGATAHVTIRIADRLDPSRSQEWLLAESWWADVFRPATFGETAIWTIAVGPSLITGQLVNMVRRLIFEDRSWTHGSLVSLALLPLRLLVAVLLTFVAVVAATLLTPLAILLLVLSLVPVPFISDFAKRVAANLAGSFGDLLVLVRSPIRFAAMAERVRQDIDLVGRRCDDMFVVAHSQGSAVAWHAIRRVAAARAAAGDTAPAPTLSRFVTFGQALRKLKALYRFSTEGEPWRTIATGLASAITLLLAGVAWVVGSAFATALGGVTPDAAWVTNVAYLLSAAVVLLVPLALIVRHNEEKTQEKLAQELETVQRGMGDDFGWVDLWASADPASNGPLFDDLPAGVTSHRIRNSASTLLDHSTYWSNVTEFVSAIVLLAAHRTGPTGIPAPVWVPDRLRDAARIRDRRVAMLAVGRIAYFSGLAVGLVAFGDRLAGIGADITTWIGDLPLLPDWFDGWSSFALGVTGGLAVGIGALLVWILLGWVRSGVDRLDTTAFFGGSVGWLAELTAWAWLAIVLVVPWAVSWFLGLDPPMEGWSWYVGLSAGLVVAWWILQRGGTSLADEEP